MACIYQIKNIVNNKIYIGSTQKENSHLRKHEHFCKLNGNYHNNKHLQSSWNKYGKENFIFEIIEDLVFPVEYEYIMSRELYFIKILNPSYNVARETKGGKLGRVISEEQKEHLRNLNTGRKVSDETKAKIKLARSKQVITKEHKRNISLSTKGISKNKGRKQSEEQKENTSKKVLELNRLGIGFHSKESKEKRTKTLKVKFNTLEMKEKLKLSARNRNRKIFIGYDSNHNVIGEFSNQTEAGEILNLKASEIGAVLRQKQKTTKGYSFVYKNI